MRLPACVTDVIFQMGTFWQFDILPAWLLWEMPWHRDLTESRVKKIQDNFDLRGFTPLVVVWDADLGKFVVCDGRHHGTAYLRWAGDNAGKIAVRLVDGDAWKMYILHNQNTRNVNSNELFKCRLIGGKCREEVYIVKQLNARNIQLVFGGGTAVPGVTRAANAFKQLFQASGSRGNFEAVLDTLGACFSEPSGGLLTTTALGADFITGIRKMLRTTAYTPHDIDTGLYNARYNSKDQHVDEWTAGAYIEMACKRKRGHRSQRDQIGKLLADALTKHAFA